MTKIETKQNTLSRIKTDNTKEELQHKDIYFINKYHWQLKPASIRKACEGFKLSDLKLLLKLELRYYWLPAKLHMSPNL
jgi:hypothetical protein